jgi:hypothetical protein
MRTALACLFLLAACAGGPSPAPGAAPAATNAPSATATAPATSASTVDASTAAVAADAGTEAGASLVSDGNEFMEKCQELGKDFEKSVRPDLKKCHADASKKEYQRGKVKITFKIDWDGTKKEIKTAEKPTLPDALVKCMLKVVKDAKFPDPEPCKGKDVTLIEQFPPQ